MLVIVDQDTFAEPRDYRLTVLQLFAVARRMGHTLVTSPAFSRGDGSLLDSWLDDLPSMLSEAISETLGLSMLAWPSLSASWRRRLRRTTWRG